MNSRAAMQDFLMGRYLVLGNFFLCQTCCFLPRHSPAALVMDLEELVDLLQREARRLDIKVPDEGQPSDVQHSEDDIKFPANVGNTCSFLLAYISE